MPIEILPLILCVEPYILMKTDLKRALGLRDLMLLNIVAVYTPGTC
ncbi:MAG: hypothetical protein JST85_01495 [Acidobacteria bacterium]|nr:hypothetical protein [Acidobacteriota bacterium]